ncbi:MAG TPA: redoxin domain-containing protein [Jatrophihabitantaceae bacterium]|jgi:peroxiredoxin/ketosteroid isomerase-like protein
MPLLHPGDPFPPVTVAPPGGGTLQLPEALAGRYGVVLFNRGSWCPYCNAQLRAFQRAEDSLAEVGATVVALSVDDEATTQELIAKHGLQFPVGHSADAHALAQATGAFVNAEPTYLQATGFVLDPTGHVIVSVYSSGAIGRLVPDDVIGLIRYTRDHAAATPAQAPDARRAPATLDVLQDFLHRLGDRDLDGVVHLLSDPVDWVIAGAPHVPWTGRRTSPGEVKDALAALADAITPQEFALSTVLTQGPHAVALGRFTQRVNATGATFSSDFAIHVTVEGGKITRYRILEDSHAVAEGMAER